MKKKSIRAGIEALLQNTLGNIERDAKKDDVVVDTIILKKIKEVKITVMMDKSLVKKAKSLSYWQRSNLKTIMHAALDNYISEYEKQNGIINPIPD